MGRPYASHPWFSTEQLCISVSFFFFFSLLGLSSCNALELSCSAAPQLWSGINPLSPALQGRFLTIQTTGEVPAFPFLIVGFCILFHFQEKSSGPKRHRN